VATVPKIATGSVPNTDAEHFWDGCPVEPNDCEDSPVADLKTVRSPKGFGRTALGTSVAEARG
jgi:hypothetical protein